MQKCDKYQQGVQSSELRVRNSKLRIPNSEFHIGFTTSFPVEVVFAAGLMPIDLNNVFILNNPSQLVKKAELAGFPRNICSWIKGMYVVSELASDQLSNSELHTIIGIVQGDCSNTHSLMDILKDSGKQVIPFSYPYNRDKKMLDKEIKELESIFQVSREETQKIKQTLDQIRKKLIYLDEMTWKTNQVTSYENHIWLVTSSDFNGNYQKYTDDLNIFLEQAKNRDPFRNKLRLGFVGVPPILEDIYFFVEECGARVVFNEVQRQFSMFYLEEDIVEQYSRFTYPYSIFDRIEDIKRAIKERNINGLLCYTQSFCHRQLDIISLKKHIDIPILQIEGDKPSKLDERTKLRIESFLEIL